MGGPRYVATMNDWMRDILRRVEKLERRRSKGGGGGGDDDLSWRPRVDALEKHVKGDPQNAYEIGLVPNDESSAITALNASRINEALTQGDVFLPPGLWSFSDSVKIPSERQLLGSGMEQTLVKTSSGTDRNVPTITNLHNTNSAHTTVDHHIRVADLSVNGNYGNRTGGGQVNANGCAIKWATVKYVSVDRVYAYNGAHSFDTAASVYQDGDLPVDDPNKQPPGPSRFVYYNECIAGGSDDDAFTTHDSDHIYFTNCVAWNHESTPRSTHSNGFEVDDGSRDVYLDNCFSHGFHDGVQVKGHDQMLPSRRIHISNTHIDNCQYGFRVFWDGRPWDTYDGPQPDYELCADVSITDCGVSNLRSFGTSYEICPALYIEAYTHVAVENFSIRDSPRSNVWMRYGCRNVRINKMFIENSWTDPREPDTAFFQTYRLGNNIHLSNIYNRTPITTPFIKVNLMYGWGSFLAEDLEIYGSGDAAVWMELINERYMIRRMRQTGYTNDVYASRGAREGYHSPAPIVPGWWSDLQA